ncbi:MAG: GntR family transcriptional regulator [Solirubrobacteraceae bacterium]
MDLRLDRDSDIPLGVQLGWALRSAISELGAGDRLPSVREIAASARVNINTARTVYARLETEGLIRVEHGRGTFVADHGPTDDRLAGVARRALAEAAEAGLDPRELAAALYAGRVADPEPAARRRALRAEIATLEGRLADARLARALRDAAPATTPKGGRLLSEDELQAQRDALLAKIEALDAPAVTPHRSSAASAASASTRSATRPGVVWRPVYGA